MQPGEKYGARPCPHRPPGESQPSTQGVTLRELTQVLRNHRGGRPAGLRRCRLRQRRQQHQQRQQQRRHLAIGRDRRRRLERPGGGPGSLDRRDPERERGRLDRLRPRRLRRRPRAVHRRRHRVRRHRLGVRGQRAQGRREALHRPGWRADPDPGLHLRDRGRLQPARGHRGCSSRPRRLPGSSTRRSRPGTTRRSLPTTPTPICPTRRSRRSTAPTIRARPRTSPTTWPIRRRSAWPYPVRRHLAGQGRRVRAGHVRCDRCGQERRGHDRLRRREPGGRSRHRQHQGRRLVRRTELRGRDRSLDSAKEDTSEGKYIFTYDIDRTTTDPDDTRCCCSPTRWPAPATTTPPRATSSRRC